MIGHINVSVKKVITKEGIKQILYGQVFDYAKTLKFYETTTEAPENFELEALSYGMAQKALRPLKEHFLNHPRLKHFEEYEVKWVQ